MKQSLISNVKTTNPLVGFTKSFLIMSLFIGSFYSCGKDDDQAIVVELDPVVTVTPGSLNFGDIEYNVESQVMSYELTKENLTNNVEIISPSGYQISKSATGTFEGTLVMADSDFTNNSATVYVRLTAQTTPGLIAGDIINQATALDGDVLVAVFANVLEEDEEEVPVETTLQWVENFDYSGAIVPTVVNTDNGDSNREITSDLWVSVRPGTDGVSLSDDQLTYNGYPSSALGRTVSLFFDGTDPSNDGLARNLETMITMDGQNNVTSEFKTTYVSFLYTLKENHTNSLTWPLSIGQWAPAGTTDFNNRVLVDVIANSKARIGLQFGGGSSRQFVDDVIEVGKTYLIILKSEKFDGASADDIASVFVFEAGASIPTQEPTPTIVVPSSLKRQNECVILTENNAINSTRAGGIRVANTWEDLF